MEEESVVESENKMDPEYLAALAGNLGEQMNRIESATDSYDLTGLEEIGSANGKLVFPGKIDLPQHPKANLPASVPFKPENFAIGIIGSVLADQKDVIHGSKGLSVAPSLKDIRHHDPKVLVNYPILEGDDKIIEKNKLTGKTTFTMNLSDATRILKECFELLELDQSEMQKELRTFVDNYSVGGLTDYTRSLRSRGSATLLAEKLQNKEK